MDHLKDGAGVRQPQVGGCPGHHSGESLPQTSRAGAVDPRAWDREGHQTGFTTFSQGTQPARRDHARRDPAYYSPSLPAGQAQQEAGGQGPVGGVLPPSGLVRADASTHSRPAAGPRQAMESCVCGRLCPELGLVWLWLAPQGDWVDWSLRCVYPPSAGPSGFQSLIYE